MPHWFVGTGGEVERKLYRIKGYGVVFVAVDDFEANVSVDANRFHSVELEGVNGGFVRSYFWGCVVRCKRG
eukprot:evm.model.NODE_49247_length_8301_cov_18.284184.2